MTNLTVNIQTNIDGFDIADSCNHEQALELIKLIDERQFSYEFTEEITLYLLQECLKCLAEGDDGDVKTFKSIVGKLFKKYE